jgi:alkanesulfonate monooxygenase SsuD/methylene tetrahydromethanopterin reductase-like flavin-dependent oxidoreductase (luciferase family)
MDPSVVKERFAAFGAACQAAGKRISDFDVCKMTFMAIAPDAARVRTMTHELAVKAKVTPEVLATRTLVGTPDQIAAWLCTLTELGVNHHILQVAESDQWPNYQDALELVAREVVPKVRR